MKKRRTVMIKLRTVTIARIGNENAVKLAASELAKYLKLIDSDVIIDMRICRKYDETRKDLLYVGVTEHPGVKKVENRELDDAILINVKDFSGIITGTNPRSVLIAVYRFLRELGVKWIRPGSDGEIIPEFPVEKCDVNVSEAPSYRHRAVCIEGAISYEHTFNIIDWIPKAGMNGYFTQFHTPHHFFQRWASHEHNPMLETFDMTVEDAECIRDKLIEDITDRGLMYHAVGHGWTCEPFGIKGGGWIKHEGEIPEETKQYLALVDGKRDLFGGVALNTDLCYSNPKVTETVANAVADYCEAHSEVDYLHVWLSDGTNNNCECENCKDLSASDHYVNLLNRVDEILTERNLGNRIVFAAYSDTLWAPIKKKIKNPDRFLLQFAPITRSYFESYDSIDMKNLPEAPVNIKNATVLPTAVDENVKLLTEWQARSGSRDSCVYDYHLWTAHIRDIGKYGISEIIHRDIKALENIGLGGFISCQIQRVQFPNNLPMHAMASALWDKNSDFEKMSDTYMTDCYGEHREKASRYLKDISYLLSPEFKDGADAHSNKKRLEMSQKALETAREFNVFVSELLKKDSFKYEAQRISWQYLLYNCEMAETVANIYIKKFSGAPYEEQQIYVDMLSDYMRKNEPNLHRVFDLWRNIPTKWYKYFIPNTKPQA